MTTISNNEEVLTTAEAEAGAADFVNTFHRIRDEITRFIVSQGDVVDRVLMAIACEGHVLLEGVPGLGKTALVTTIAKAVDVGFRRIQFTPDLLPADIVGSMILIERNGQKTLEFQRGPVFTNLLLADEINRATPKTQSALLETMQERSVTVAGHTSTLDRPFFVLATQNPVESDGTYPLPEAQLDRFFFKLDVPLPSEDDLLTILERTSGAQTPEIRPIACGEDFVRMARLIRHVPIDLDVQRYLIRVVRRTHPSDEHALDSVTRFIRHGASPRAAQSILAAARCRALLENRFHVSRADIRDVAPSALRHRMIMSFEGEAEGISPDTLIDSIIESLD